VLRVVSFQCFSAVVTSDNRALLILICMLHNVILYGTDYTYYCTVHNVLTYLFCFLGLFASLWMTSLLCNSGVSNTGPVGHMQPFNTLSEACSDLQLSSEQSELRNIQTASYDNE